MPTAREYPVPCQRAKCRKPTFHLDPVCDACLAADEPVEESPYYQFDLDTERVEIPEFRRSREDVLAELLAALAPEGAHQ